MPIWFSLACVRVPAWSSSTIFVFFIFPLEKGRDFDCSDMP